jgi:hypothetical protein
MVTPDYITDEYINIQEKPIYNTENNCIKIYCLGDCFTSGHLVEKGYSYPDQFQKILGEKYQVINLGRCLLRIKSLREYSHLFIPENVTENDIFCIWCGVQDLYFDLNPEEVFLDFFYFSKLIQDKGARIIVITPLLRIIDVRLNFEENRKIFNKLIKKEYTNVIDLDKILTISSPNLIRDSIFYHEDNVHLNKYGCGIIAEFVGECIKEINLGL